MLCLDTSVQILRVRIDLVPKLTAIFKRSFTSLRWWS